MKPIWQYLWGIHVLSTWLKLVWRIQKKIWSHTHSRRGLFSTIYLMSKATALVAVKCSRWFSKKCFSGTGSQVEVFLHVLSLKVNIGVHLQKSENASPVSQRPKLDSSCCAPSPSLEWSHTWGQTIGHECSFTEHLHPRWRSHVLPSSLLRWKISDFILPFLFHV